MIFCNEVIKNDEVIRYLEHDEDSDLELDGEDEDIDEGDRVWDADCKLPKSFKWCIFLNQVAFVKYSEEIHG